MPGGRSGQPGSRCARGTNTLRAAGLAAGALRGRSTTLRAAGLADGRGLSSTFSLWALGLADGRGLSPLLWTSGLADGVGLLDLSEEVEDFRPSSSSELVSPLSSVPDSLMLTIASSLTGGGCGFAGGGMSVRAFALGLSTGPACFDTDNIRPSLAGGGAHFEAGVLHGGGPSASAVAACLAPAAPAPEVFGINLALAATAAIGVFGDSSVSDSSVSEGAPGGVC